MAKLLPLWKSNPVEYLVLWKFPQLAAFRSLTPGESDALSPDERSDLRDQADAYRKELSAMPEADFQSLISEAQQDEIRRSTERQEAWERSRFFNQPRASADFVHWASASYWTVDEATALSFGKDPRVVNWKAVSQLVNASSFADSFAARRDLLHRANIMRQIGQQTAPSVLLAWAQRMQIPMPAELVEAVSALGIQIADWKSLYDAKAARVDQLQAELNEARAAHEAALDRHAEKTHTGKSAVEEPVTERPLGARERDSLLKLVIGMAIGGYGHDPKAGRSSTAKDIAGDLARVGLPLDEDTVRKYLFEARELLPGETEQEG